MHSAEFAILNSFKLPVGSDRERLSKDEGCVVMHAHVLNVGGDA